MSSSVKPKLLIVQLWQLGDLAIATPFLQKASEQFDVTLLAKPFALDLKPRFWPEVTVIPFNAPWTAFEFRKKYHLLGWPWGKMFSVLKKLLHERFDVALSARWDPRDHFLLMLTRARSRLGFPRLGSRIFLTHPLNSPNPESHQYENWLTIARALNLNLEPREKLRFPAPSSRRFIVIHTGARRPVRVWPLERYKLIMDKLRARGHIVKILCDPEQLAWWREMGEKDVTAPQSVSELLRGMEGAGGFIGNDSGPGHLAALCGVPTFTFFGPQIVEWFLPFHPSAQYMEGKPCPYKPCSDYCRFPAPHCLLDITEAEAWPNVKKFVELLSVDAEHPRADIFFKQEKHMSALAEKKCEPCDGGTPKLKGAELNRVSGELHDDWQVVNEHHLEREFKFKNFRDALAFTNKVGELAEKQGHHPDIYLAWGLVKITIWTHAVNGLTESDCVLAAKIDQIK